MNKKFLFIALLLAVNQIANAQFNFSAGYTVYPLKAPGFQTFFRTYNEVNAADLQTGFKSDFPAASGWSIRGGYLLNLNEDGPAFYYNSTTGINRLVTKNEAIFSNGEKRNTELRIREWATDVSLGVGSANFHVAVNGSFMMRDNKLFVSYVFKDGSESFGLDHNLNGVYDAIRLNVGYGAEVGIGMKYVQAVFKVAKIIAPFEKDGSTYLDYYDDLVDFKQFNPYTNSYPTQYMPADMNLFVADQLASETANNIVYINDRGWQYSLSLMFLLNTK